MALDCHFLLCWQQVGTADDEEVAEETEMRHGNEKDGSNLGQVWAPDVLASSGRVRVKHTDCLGSRVALMLWHVHLLIMSTTRED